MLNLPVCANDDSSSGRTVAGAGKGCRNMIMVTLGTGVGGGIIVNGKIVAGEHGAAGEIGHACGTLGNSRLHREITAAWNRWLLRPGL